MAQNRRPAPRRAAARCPQNPVSGRKTRPALPSGCTLRLRNIERSYTTVRCHAANSGTDAEYRRKRRSAVALEDPKIGLASVTVLGDCGWVDSQSGAYVVLRARRRA